MAEGFTLATGTSSFSLSGSNAAGESSQSASFSLVPVFANETLVIKTSSSIKIELTQSHTDAYTITAVMGPNSTSCTFTTSFNSSTSVVQILVSGLVSNTPYVFNISASYAGNDITYTTASYTTNIQEPVQTVLTNPVVLLVESENVTLTCVQNVAVDVDLVLKNQSGTTFTKTMTRNGTSLTLVITGLTNKTAYIFSLYQSGNNLLTFPSLTTSALLSPPTILSTTVNGNTATISFNTTFNAATTIPPNLLNVRLYNPARQLIAVKPFSVTWSEDYSVAFCTPIP